MKYTLYIQGMHCASCSSNAERSLKKISGVREVGVSVLTGKAIVQAEDKTNKEEFMKAIEKAGFKLVKIE